MSNIPGEQNPKIGIYHDILSSHQAKATKKIITQINIDASYIQPLSLFSPRYQLISTRKQANPSSLLNQPNPMW
jgi:hypothetical protein